MNLERTKSKLAGQLANARVGLNGPTHFHLAS